MENADTDRRRWLLGIVALGMGSAGMATSAPLAGAHTCAAYDGCDAGACKDGEEHDHTDYNYVTRDERCTSHAKDDDGGQKGCDFLGQHWPELVCDLMGQAMYLNTPGA